MKTIDWEQRTWELFKSSIETINDKEDAFRYAKECVEFYKSKIEGGLPLEQKKIEGKASLEERMETFRKACNERERTFGKVMVQEFYNYWSEPSKSKKMRWEMEKTWDIDRRMRTWASRSGFKPREEKKVDQEYLNFIKKQ